MIIRAEAGKMLQDLVAKSEANSLLDEDSSNTSTTNASHFEAEFYKAMLTEDDGIYETWIRQTIESICELPVRDALIAIDGQLKENLLIRVERHAECIKDKIEEQSQALKTSLIRPSVRANDEQMTPKDDGDIRCDLGLIYYGLRGAFYGPNPTCTHDVSKVHGLFSQLEGFVKLDPEVVENMRFESLLRGINQLTLVPKDDIYQFKERAAKLLSSWQERGLLKTNQR